MKTSLLMAVVLSLILASGCSWMPFFGKDKDSGEDEFDPDATEQYVYRAIQRDLKAGNYERAIEGLQRLEAQFPFGRYAEQAQLEIIYANFMGFDFDGARNAADRFIRLHPQNPNVDYAYYVKGVSSFNKSRGLLDRLFSTDISKRDMTSAQEAYADFSQLIAQYPASAYAPDSRKRMIYLRDLLAQAEVNIASFYMKRGAYVAAANRVRFVIENYPRAEAVPDALAIMVEASYRLGQEDAANDALRVLSVNFPAYPAFDKDGNLVLSSQILNRDRSWTNMVTLGLIDRPDVPPPIKLRQPETL